MSERNRNHSEVSSLLTKLSDGVLIELLEAIEGKPGWGMTCSLRIEGHLSFVKLIPVTELELANLGSTRNLYDLPTVYNYGVGSAGFGAAREVAAHLKTTQWVLDGKIENFPLLYHHRVLPVPAKTRKRDRRKEPLW